MSYSVSLMRQLENVDPALRQVLWSILEEIEHHRAVTVTREDFADLRAVVTSLAEAQQRTEAQMTLLGTRMDQLTAAQQRTEAQMTLLGTRMDQLTEAQQRTEAQMTLLGTRMDQLTAAQQRTEIELGKLAAAQTETQKAMAVLDRVMVDTRSEVGGLARSAAYALENEAYRQLPKLLEGRGIKLTDRFVRTTLAGEEINFLARAEREGQPLVIVGESVLRLRGSAKLAQLRAHQALAAAAFGLPTLPLLVTHFARPNIREKLEALGVIVVESFEWA